MRSALKSEKNRFHTKDQQRWRIVKRKKLVLNCCMSLAFAMSFVVTSAAYAAPGNGNGNGNGNGGTTITATTLPENPHTLVGSAAYSFDNVNHIHDVDMNSSYVKTRYDSFNIGSAATVNVLGHNGGGTFVAKVKDTGNTSMSYIYGTLNASGVNVFLMNTAGFTFGAGANINVGSLGVTTAKTQSFDDSTSTLSFSEFGNGKIINDANITVSQGGFAVLAGPYVENNGFIQADLGQIQLASSTEMTVDLRGDGLITFGATPADLGSTEIGVKNTGTLQARSGTVAISAKEVSNIIENSVNLDGVVDADSFGTGTNGGTANGGTDGNGGVVTAIAEDTTLFSEDASISATGGDTEGNAGFVEISGAHVGVAGSIDLSAANGNGGFLLIDPADLRIRNGSGSAIADVIYENVIESVSQGGAKVALLATNSITLEDLADNQLQGAGTITLSTTGLGGTGTTGSISFDDKNDGITTTFGSIILSAGEGGIDVGHLKTDA
ncbi:MAG: hypothetical protein K0R98_1851, partial [Rickettsiaceae bacterium]|nr:hypothetical protein [Rickettsiaceae bacterium]